MNTRRKNVALVIWMCEGTKKRKDKRWKNSYICPVEVTNTDAKIVKIFVDFLNKDLGIPISKFKGQIQIHEGDDKEEIEEYWSKVTSIPRHQLNKTIIRKRGNKPGKSKGTFKVRFYNKSVYDRLSHMLNDLVNEFCI
jgi:hypothetical protein